MIDPESLKAKSDQMNAVDLVNPMIFRVDHATYDKNREQPIHIHLVGHEGRPYKPNKGMARGLVSTQVWTLDETTWKGRLIELYCEPTVKWAGKEAGGIEISAVSHIKQPYRFNVTLNRHQRKIHTFNVLADDTEVKKEFVKTHYIDDIQQCKTDAEIDAIVKHVMDEFDKKCLMELKGDVEKAREALKNPPEESK